MGTGTSSLCSVYRDSPQPRVTGHWRGNWKWNFPFSQNFKFKIKLSGREGEGKGGDKRRGEEKKGKKRKGEERRREERRKARHIMNVTENGYTEPPVINMEAT